MSKQIKDISFTYYGVQGTHKIQLLTYSCNVQGAFAVKLSLKNVKTDQRYQFYCTILYHTVPYYTVPFDIALSHFTQRYTICVYAVPFDITLSHLGREFLRKLCDPLRQYDFIVLAVVSL